VTFSVDRQLEVFRACVEKGSQKAAAEALGISLHTVKNVNALLYDRLGVQSNVQCALALGWLVVPKEKAA
jgi:DNA-binding NarL/FixJ family response regulator